MRDDRQPEPEPPSRSELRLEEQALRQDWPIPPRVKTRILQRLVNLLDDDGPEPDDRLAIRAAAVLAQFGRLSLGQQAIDLRRELAAPGRSGELDLEQILADAERRAGIGPEGADRPAPGPLP